MNKFCGECGAKIISEEMRADEASEFFDRYDTETGEESFVRVYSCPNNSSWSGEHFKSFGDVFTK